MLRSKISGYGGIMNTRISVAIGLIVGAGGALLASPATYAQSVQSDASSDTLQEVVVTAQRREEKMVDVPISIAAIDSQQLATANVQDLSDIRN